MSWQLSTKLPAQLQVAVRAEETAWLHGTLAAIIMSDHACLLFNNRDAFINLLVYAVVCRAELLA